MSAEQAMQEYVSCVHALDPEGSEKVNNKLTVGAIAYGDGKQHIHKSQSTYISYGLTDLHSIVLMDCHLSTWRWICCSQNKARH